MRRWWTRSNSDLSAAEYATDVSRCLDMYAVYKSLFPRTRHFVWQSTPVQVSDLTTGWTGSVRVAVLDIRGSASWGSTSGLLQLPPGIWSVIVKSGGRNDPSPVKRSSEWVSDILKVHLLQLDIHYPSRGILRYFAKSASSLYHALLSGLWPTICGQLSAN